MTRILVAGIGNLFKGDDGFGVAVARELMRRGVPEGVRVGDFGIRGLDLVYALLDGYDAVILVDAVPHGAVAGTVSVIEPELDQGENESEMIGLSPHAMDPVAVLRVARQLGEPCRRISLVGCEPESFGDDEFGAMELSPAVAAAVGPAANTVERLALELTQKLLEEEAA